MTDVSQTCPCYAAAAAGRQGQACALRSCDDGAHLVQPDHVTSAVYAAELTRGGTYNHHGCQQRWVKCPG